MDNTGAYVTRGQLLLEAANAGKAVATAIALSAKTATTGDNAKFTFTPSSPTPVVGWWVVQGTKAAPIIALPSGTEIELEGGNLEIANGSAKLIQTTLSAFDLDELIANAMALIDRHTRQWFNARSLTVKMEGSNAETLFLEVPIISVSSLTINEESAPLDSSQYVVFASRSYPDDRRNPMIKTKQVQDSDIFELRSRKFMRGKLQEIVGVFGFLEADGSTPRLIQRATLKLAVKGLVLTVGQSAAMSATSAAGKIKRERTDMHEVEYFDDSSSEKNASLTGDEEVDSIIAAYRSPILLGGPMPDIGVESAMIQGGLGERGEFY